MLHRKKYLLLALLVLGFGTILFAIKEYNRKPVAVEQLDPDFITGGKELIAAFTENQAAATQKFLGKTIELNGTIRSVEQAGNSLTLVLGETVPGTAIRCSMDSASASGNNSYQTGQDITIKGICTGFIADDMGLGSDIVLNKCITIKTKKQ